MSELHAPDDLLLAAWAGLLSEQEPGEQAKLRIRATLLANIRKSGPVITRSDAVQWQPILPGVQIKTLHRDEQAGTQTTLWRMQPGAKIPAHPHSRDEECLMIEGSIVQDGSEYFPGDFLLARAGSLHASIESPNGALFMIRGEPLSEGGALKNPIA